MICKAFDDDCQSVLSATTANDIQETFEKLRLQEFNDQNLARRLANHPEPPLAPLRTLQDHLKSTGESIISANFNQLNVHDNYKSLADRDRQSESNLAQDYFKNPKLHLPYEFSLKSTGESTFRALSAQHNQHKTHNDYKSSNSFSDQRLADRKEKADKLIATFPQQKIKKVCEVCRESVDRYSVFPCGHIYCNMCTAKVFKSAIGDRSLLPIKCCRVEVDQNLAKLVLDSDDLNKFREILHEVETKEKMYW